MAILVNDAFTYYGHDTGRFDKAIKVYCAYSVNKPGSAKFYKENGARWVFDQHEEVELIGPVNTRVIPMNVQMVPELRGRSTVYIYKIVNKKAELLAPNIDEWPDKIEIQELDNYIGYVIYKGQKADNDWFEKNYTYNFTNATYEKQGKSTMSKLYKVVDKEIYGNYLATNGEGKIVLDLKGGGVAAYTKEEIEEVVPYSVGVRFRNDTGSSMSSKIYHYWVDRGAVEVNDVVFAADYSNPAIVVELDTKSASANKRLTGFVVPSKGFLT